MPTDVSPHPGAPIQTAIDRVRHFVVQVTGEPASDAEIADALGRYFVLKEIADHILMARSAKEP